MHTKVPHQTPDYRLEALDGELLLFHPSRQKIMYCNQTASLVWQLCDGQRSVANIVNLIQEAYPEARDSVPLDVERALQQFAEHGAVHLT